MRRRLIALVGLVCGILSERSRADELPTVSGPTGLLHTPTATGSEPGTVRASLHLDWFRASGFLCTPRFPCVGSTSDEHRHSGAVASVGGTLVRGLDVYVAARAYSNDSSRSAELFEVFGDTTIGARYVHALRALHVGGGAEVLALGGPGNVGIAGAATSFRLRALSTVALNELRRPLPIRLHLSFAYLFDNSGALVSDVERARSSTITRVERYGLGISKVDRVEVNLGAELAPTRARVQPFLEYGLAVPVNRQQHHCGARSDDEPCRASLAAMPSKLTLGARLLPFSTAAANVSLLLALDIGMTGTARFATEIAPQAPYTFWLGVSFSARTADPPPRVVVERVEVPVPPPYVVLRGFVHVAGTETPVANAIVSFVGSSRPPLATDERGYFGDEVDPGTYEVRVRAPGFKDNTCGGTAVAAGPTRRVLTLDCPLERTAK